MVCGSIDFNAREQAALPNAAQNCQHCAALANPLNLAQSFAVKGGHVTGSFVI
jgi:hypothetical protein